MRRRTTGARTGDRDHRGVRAGSSAVRSLLLAAVFAVPLLVTVQLKHLGEDRVEAERDMQAVITELQLQDGLEWRAISGRVTPDDVAPSLAASRDRAQALLARVDAHDEHVAEMVVLHDQYAAVVDEQLSLLRAGRTEEAAEFDEAHVDPAFEAAVEALEEHKAEVALAAAHARWMSDLGVCGTVLIALASTTLVQSRRRRAEVRRQAERRSEARYRALVDQSTDLVLVTDRAGRVRFLSPSAERLLAGGRSAGSPEAETVDLLAAVHAPDRPALAAMLQDATVGAGWTIEVGIAIGEGVRTFEVSVQDLTDAPAVGGLVLTGHDVTGRRALQAEMEYRALHDTLTGLPNRALLADRFEQVLRDAHRDGTSAGLLIIDLDRFKEINDTFGHCYGDALLTQIGPRLRAVLREVDTVARLGGDEFAVLLPDVRDVDSVIAVAVTLQAALQAPFQVEGVDLDVEASIGAVVSGEHGEDTGTLMQRADIAMYVAKNENLGVFAYDPAVDGHSPDMLALLGDP